ncbi:hypothetical protein ACFL3Q_09850, partial [Planctomycetota bacterium]
MAQFPVAKPLQPKYNSTTRYLPIILDAPFVSALKTVAYERPKFDNVFNGRCEFMLWLSFCTLRPLEKSLVSGLWLPRSHGL